MTKIDKINKLVIPNKRSKDLVVNTFNKKDENSKSSLFHNNEDLKELKKTAISLFASYSIEEVREMKDPSNRPEIFNNFYFESLIDMFYENGEDFERFKKGITRSYLKNLDKAQEKSLDVIYSGLEKDNGANGFDFFKADISVTREAKEVEDIK
jgi:hypothetical protein